MEAYSYHPMTIADYNEAYALWKSIPGIGLSEADSRISIEMYLIRNPEQSFICKSDGKIVGTILCGNDGRRAYIHHTAVAPEYRRQGIASNLVCLALEAQKKCGIQKCHLFIINENGLGKAFWSKTEFTERLDIGIMSRNLL